MCNSRLIMRGEAGLVRARLGWERRGQARQGYTMASLNDWLSRLSGARKSGRGYVAKCPAHDDNSPSLSVTESDNGVVLAKCFAGCDYKAIVAALGLEPGGKAAPPPARPQTARRRRPEPAPLPTAGNGVRVWRYHDEMGNDSFAVVRRDPGKRFSQWTPIPDSDLWLAVGLESGRPLYRLPSLHRAEKVVVVEGEGCVHAVLDAWPVVATTWAGGTNAWQLADWTPLAGKNVTIVADADNDAPPDKPNAKDRVGQDAALRIAALLTELGCAVRIALPEPADSEDIADWLAKGKDYAKQRLDELLVDFTPDMAPEPKEEPPSRFDVQQALDSDQLSVNEHYRILGLQGNRVAVRFGNGTIDDHTRASLTQKSTLVSLAPVAWWKALTGNELGDRTSMLIGDGLIRAADRLGQIDLAHAYDRGAARLPDGTVVYHLGDRLLVNGEERGLDLDTYYWLAGPRIELAPAAKPEAARDIADAVMQYRWLTELHGKRMLGWIVAAIVGGALEWRPHIMLSAPAGAGKSWLLSEVLDRLMGTLLRRIADATPAAFGAPYCALLAAGCRRRGRTLKRLGDRPAIAAPHSIRRGGPAHTSGHKERRGASTNATVFGHIFVHSYAAPVKGERLKANGGGFGRRR